MSHWNEAAGMAFLLNLAVKSTALLAAAWIAAFALRRRSAAARHIVWMAAFAAALALPVLSIALPALQLPGMAWLPDAPRWCFVRMHVCPRSASRRRRDCDGFSSRGRHPQTPLGSDFDWPLWVMLIWCGGSAALLGADDRGVPPHGAAPPAVARVRCSLRPARGVQVLEAPAGSMPMTFGVLHPVVFLPADAMEWSEERRAMVVRHELAHIERGDAAMHLAARAAISLLWWNPLAWKAWREFLKEREKAADDLVLAGGARASDYAGHLLEIARSMQSEPATAWAAVAMARRSQLEGRLLSILDGACEP